VARKEKDALRLKTKEKWGFIEHRLSIIYTPRLVYLSISSLSYKYAEFTLIRAASIKE
jgi:hypothetical protein